MDTFEWTAWGVLVALGLLAALLRPLLAKKQGHPLSLFWVLQGYLFPGLMLLSGVLLLAGTADLMLPALALGIAEELIFSFFRNRRSKPE